MEDMVLYQKVFLTTFLKNINLSLNGDREVFLIYIFLYVYCWWNSFLGTVLVKQVVGCTLRLVWWWDSLFETVMVQEITIINFQNSF